MPSRAALVVAHGSVRVAGRGGGQTPKPRNGTIYARGTGSQTWGGGSGASGARARCRAGGLLEGVLEHRQVLESRIELFDPGERLRGRLDVVFRRQRHDAEIQ